MGRRTLVVGADNFPFPIPLKKNNDGQWFFDTAAGKQEVLNRRIGRNELASSKLAKQWPMPRRSISQQKHGGRETVRAEVHQRSRAAEWPVLAGGRVNRESAGSAGGECNGGRIQADQTRMSLSTAIIFVMLTSRVGMRRRRERLYGRRENGGRIRGRGLSGEVRQFRRHDVHGQPGWRDCAERPGTVDRSGCFRDDRVQSRQDLDGSAVITA